MLYQVKLNQFEGPLDLLLELIEKEKMDITEVSLSKVTDDYLKYLEGVENIKPSILADFLHIAAHLILIKSRSLLPDLEFEEEEEISTEDLKNRLIEYKKFKDMAMKFGEMYKGEYTSYEKKISAEDVNVFYPGRSLTNASFTRAVGRLTSQIVKFEELEEKTIKDVVSIKEKIGQIKDLITKRVNVKFSNILKGNKSKLDTVVSFLALLELIKQKILKVEQKELFGDIELAKTSTLPMAGVRVVSDNQYK